MIIAHAAVQANGGMVMPVRVVSLHLTFQVLPCPPSLTIICPVTVSTYPLLPTQSWFDIRTFSLNSDEDEPGMLRTTHLLNQLITAEVDSGIPPANIVLGGFSQGGAMTLLTGLTTERKLAGLAVLSGWLPLAGKVKAVSDSEHSAWNTFLL